MTESQKQVFQAGLDALVYMASMYTDRHDPILENPIATMRAALLEEDPKPIGEVDQIDIDEDGQPSAWISLHTPVDLGTKIYASPLSGLIPVTMEWEPGYPEDVAFGTPMQAARLKKWLDKYFAMVIANKHTPQPPNNWSVLNNCAEVASNLSYTEAYSYLTPERLDRGWTAVCVVDKSNIQDPTARPDSENPCSSDELQKAYDKIAELEQLCDRTYVAQGADAYNHACSEMERWQLERAVAGKQVGTTHSLCDGIAWLYEYVNTLEKSRNDVIESCAVTAWSTGMDLHMKALPDTREIGSACARAIRELKS